MPSFLLLAGLGSYLVIGLLCVAAFAVAGVGAYFYLRAKNREALDPAKGLAAGDAPVALGEMRELTSRIEEIVTTQQDHGETQRAHLSRKIDQVRESVESQHHAVTGLRHELRHEIERRDAEMTEIRHQIATVRDGLALPPGERAALPPGPSAAELGAPETEAEMRAISFEEEPEEATFTEVPAAEDAPAEEAASEESPASTFDEVAFAPLDAEPGEEADGLSFAFEDDDAATPEPGPLFSFEDAAFEPAPEAPAYEDTPDPLSPAALPAFAFEDDDAPAASAPAPEPTEIEPVAAASTEPAEADRQPDEAPAFAFEDDEPVAFAPDEEPADAPVAEADAEPEGLAFAFSEDDDAPADPSESFEVVSFLEPETESAQEASPFAFEAEEDEAADAPMALAFEDDETATVNGTARFADVPSGNGMASQPPPPPSPTFAPAISAPEAEDEPRETAWISRSDRQDDAPKETIGGIEVERVGDVPPVAETPATPEPDAAEPEAPVDPPAPPFVAPSFDDEFPAPVVASELAEETGFDFGFDVDAELEAFDQAPFDEPGGDSQAPPLRHAPVPPFQMTAPEEEADAPASPASETPAPAPEPTPEPEPEVEPYTPPEGAEDLAVLSSVDEDTCRALHMAGVLTLDEIARWGRSDARRIASEVGVSEETIMHQWVFEAQSALFERYSRR